MAEAPGHLLGQMIGSLLEMASEPELRALCVKHAFHLDTKGLRPGVRAGKLLSLTDLNGNKHDLDFVIERPTSDSRERVYAAFVECAWRRYTKHSKAKAQEIQGAVLPLLEAHAEVGPTPAAIVAGQWSRPSIKQLESCGFVIMHMDFGILSQAFLNFGVDIAGRDKELDSFWLKQVATLRTMDTSSRSHLVERIRKVFNEDYRSFIKELEGRIVRAVSAVIVRPLHGLVLRFDTIDRALRAVRKYSGQPQSTTFLRYEIEVVYTNGDVIRGNYGSEANAIAFLEKLG